MITSPAQADLSYLRQLVFEQSCNVLDPSRDYLLESRLAPLLRSHGFTQMEELIQLLRAGHNPTLKRAVADAMTINETSFFRDGRPFEVLRSELLPRLIAARRTIRTLRLWSAACSTGQEAYSLAMLLTEHFPEITGPGTAGVPGWKLRIEGTDIASEVVRRAQAGIYRRIEINRGLPARYIVRYFDHVGENWSIKPEIHALCHFRQANLAGNRLPFLPSTGRFDVIFLRNVMLYFSQQTRIKLLLNIHKLLAPDGVLFLGASEQPADPSIWTPALAGGTCYFRPRLAG